MHIIPAIDLLKGNVVRLTRGDMHQVKVYSDDPLKVALTWQALGADCLHIVDLSAAFEDGDNIAVIKEIAKKTTITIQVGGGIRDIKKAKDLLSCGVGRVIVGTRSIEKDFLKTLISEVGSDRVAVGVDVKEGMVAIKGWQEISHIKGFDFIESLIAQGVTWVIYTDISRDGTLQGIDDKEIVKLGQFTKLNIVTSGGYAHLDDIKTTVKHAPFVRGIILGKSLYEGTINLKDAIAIAK